MNGPLLRCKMRVASVTRSIGSDGEAQREIVQLHAVASAQGTENAEWSKYTPLADFNLTIDNPSAFDRLRNGQEFYVDFTSAKVAEMAKVVVEA